MNHEVVSGEEDPALSSRKVMGHQLAFDCACHLAISNDHQMEFGFL